MGLLEAAAYAAGTLVGTLQAAAQADTADRPTTQNELAPLKRDTHDWGMESLPVLPNPDATAAHQQAKLADYRYAYGLYQELKHRDPHLQSVLSQRVGAVTAAPRSLQPAAETPEAQGVADTVRAILDAIPGWDGDLREMAQACYLGVSYHEVLWERGVVELDGAAREVLRIAKLAHRRERRFVYTPDAELRLLTPEAMVEGEALPPRAILVHRPLAEYENPYGDGLAQTAYWYCKFKKDCVTWWQIFNEKFASPTIKATRPLTMSEDEKRELKRILRNVQQETGLIVPEGVVIDLLEAQKTGTISSYEKFAEYCDNALSKLFLGQTLTTQQGDTGARAMAQVHLDVRGDLIRQDAQALCETVDELIRWIVDLNYPEGQRHYPHYQIDTDPPVDAAANLLKFDTALNKLKLPLSKAQVYEEGNLVQPEADSEDELKPQAPPPSPFTIGGGLPTGGDPSPNVPPKPDPAADPTQDKPQAATGRRYTLLASEGQLPGAKLAQHYAAGVKAAAELTAAIPGNVRDWVLSEAARIGLGAEDAIGDPAKLPWDEWTLPERDALVEQLNNDLSIGYLLGRAASGGATAAARPAVTLLAADSEAENPLVEALWGEKRIIPRRVLSVFTRKVHESLTWEAFYQADALSRAASFTAWDLCESDIRHIGGALQDAIHNGWTCQQFADYLYDRLEARYVSQEGTLHAWHVETIYHTNLATAYNQAAMDELWDSRDDNPYVMVINPDPQHPLCVELAGRVMRIEDLRGYAGVPPFHFGCGSSISGMNETELQQSGLTLMDTPPVNSPEVYSGPGGRGTPQSFGAWAPLDERYAHLEAA